MHSINKQTGKFLLVIGLILGCWKGRVALFAEGMIHPVKVYPYRAEMLPPADRCSLEKGIPVASEEQLEKLLQDYLS